MVAKYERPDLRRSIWQIVNSAGPYLVLWVLMYLSLSVSYWLTLALAVDDRLDQRRTARAEQLNLDATERERYEEPRSGKSRRNKR